MIIYKCIELPEQEFSSKEEMFFALKANADNIIELKKTVKHSDSIEVENSVSKAMDLEEGFIYPVINTTKYMDSHNDVHADGIWDVSIKQQKGKIYYVADHELKVTNIIAFPQDVEPMVKEVKWKELGAKYSGNTQALMFKVSKSAIQLDAAEKIINDRRPIEHSVRMQYVKLTLAINSENEDFKKEKANWEKYYPEVVNKDRADDVGYFWWISEAKIYKEGSMVIAGSNDITPMVYPKEIDPSADSQKNHPEDTSDEDKRMNFLLNY